MSEGGARHLPAEIWRIIANLKAESPLSEDGASSSNHENEHEGYLHTGPVNTILDLSDRAKLSRVCKAARTALLPTLYRRLDLRRDGSQKLLRTLSNDSKLATLVQAAFWDISIDAALSESEDQNDTHNSSPTLGIKAIQSSETSASQHDVRPPAVLFTPFSKRLFARRAIHRRRTLGPVCRDCFKTEKSESHEDLPYSSYVRVSFLCE
jgi:hypothetical protein